MGLTSLLQQAAVKLQPYTQQAADVVWPHLQPAVQAATPYVQQVPYVCSPWCSLQRNRRTVMPCCASLLTCAHDICCCSCSQASGAVQPLVQQVSIAASQASEYAMGTLRNVTAAWQ